MPKRPAPPARSTTDRRPLVAVALVAAVTVAAGFLGCLSHARHEALPVAPPRSLPLDGVTVVLDPGHGGQDSGAVCRYTVPLPIPPKAARPAPLPTIKPAVTLATFPTPKPVPPSPPPPPPVEVRKLYEASVNYRMASVVAETLRAEGATVVLTVTSSAILTGLKEGSKTEPPLAFPSDARLAYNDTPIRARLNESPDDLYRRAAVAQKVWHDNGSGGRLYFLSLHCDKLDAGSHGRGARVYRDKRDKGTPLLAVRLKDRLTRAGLTNSPHGMVIPREYGVLNGKYNPIGERVLLEMATISDPGDRRAVQNPAWRWKLAHLIADSIEDCERARGSVPHPTITRPVVAGPPM